MEDRVKQLQDRIAHLYDDIERMEDQHGTGVRPSWVGEEIGINLAYIQKAKRELEQLGGVV